MVASLVKEDSNSGTSCLEQLAELVHCMVFRFPGFPDLYEPVMEAIKVRDIPPLLPHLVVAAPIIWPLAVSYCLPSPPCASGMQSHLPFPQILSYD